MGFQLGGLSSRSDSTQQDPRDAFCQHAEWIPGELEHLTSADWRMWREGVGGFVDGLGGVGEDKDVEST